MTDRSEIPKRLMDLLLGGLGLLLSIPIILPFMAIVWLQDFRSPFYLSARIGKGGKSFCLIKLRSMVVGADLKKVDTTTARDPRITPVGRLIRAFKLDELPQFWNVVRGDMSLVGPRPNVQRETDRYTEEEKRLLSVRPGVTDIASIVFSNLGEILKDSTDPNGDYGRLIRPWKSQLGLFYIAHRSLRVDLELLLLTLHSLFHHRLAARRVARMLVRLGADDELVRLARGEVEIVPSLPLEGDPVLLSHQPRSTG